MRNAKRAALLVLLSALSAGCTVAQSRSAEQQVKEQPEATPQAQEERAAVPQPKDKPAEPATPRQPQARRATQANIQRVQPIPQAGTASYGPVLTPGARPGSLPSPSPTPPAGLPPPATLNSCAGGQCTDAAGNSYNLGTGQAGTDSQGRLCNRSGSTVQCF